MNYTIEKKGESFNLVREDKTAIQGLSIEEAFVLLTSQNLHESLEELYVRINVPDNSILFGHEIKDAISRSFLPYQNRGNETKTILLGDNNGH